jgi:signal transduction histidine kinase
MLLSTGIGIFTLFHVQREERHLIEATRESAELLLNTVEKSIFNSMAVGNSSDVQAILERVGESRQLAHLRIFHPDGTILKSSYPQEIGLRVNNNDLSLFANQQQDGIYQIGGEPMLGMVRTIVSDERCYACHGEGHKVVGVLNLNYSLNEMMRRIGETSKFFLYSTVVVVSLLALGISFILLRFVKRPIQAMAAIMARVEEGDMTVRMEPNLNDEIGVLMRSFNSMVDNLERAQGELKACHYQQMERADRLASVGEMAAGIAHEVKNPLAGISGAITVLADDFAEDDPRTEIVREVLGQIKRLDKTVNDLLYFGRPGEPEFNFVDINALVKSTLFFISQHPEAKNIHRIKELTRDLPAVWIDEKQIQQVLFNVILNAIQAMPDGGTLAIETDLAERNDERAVRVRVIDTGKGITDNEMEKIFVPFHTTKTQGTGLGLSICRQLILQHGGNIQVKSQPGSGTTVTIELPLATGRGIGPDNKKR